MKGIKKFSLISLIVLTLGGLGACSSNNEANKDSSETASSSSSQAESGHVLIAAAASLENVMEKELIPAFEKEHSGVTIEGNYDSSGKLQTQIEKGLEADIFFSAATKQMDALVSQKLVAKDEVVPLLENQLVLIVPKNSDKDWKDFNDLKKAEMVAIGDPASVPAGQYAEKGLKALGIWDEVKEHASFGTNVTEVLNWVAKGSSEAGLVYATDAASSDEVKIIATLPEDTLDDPIIYPVAPLEKTKDNKAAADFLDFLQSDTAAKAFKEAGFTVNK
ncbi:molybdate ABC transporter substrate-binding protein [Enterococcus sp. UD-01]|jgi:molybdate transport system substrate-binding protein|uniref:molybdate ABC transporter substrate-binding protein n=1 Tax=Enterococcus sp. UD-01 TaxID=3373911 RepID=UPI003833C5CC